MRVACPRLHLATVDNGLRQGLLCSGTPEELRQMSVGQQADESGRITRRGASSAQHHAIAEKTSWGDPGRKGCRRSDQAWLRVGLENQKVTGYIIILSSRLEPACMEGTTQESEQGHIGDVLRSITPLLGWSLDASLTQSLYSLRPACGKDQAVGVYPECTNGNCCTLICPHCNCNWMTAAAGAIRRRAQ